MAETPWDAIIVGQGLAGTTLAWHLVEAGRRVLVIDAGEPVTSSKIAAGLVTPITGKRLYLSWRCDEFLPVARSFYPRIERRTGQTFFHDRIALRLFRSDKERQTWLKRSVQPEYQTHQLDPQPSPLIDPALADAGHGGFAMHAAQLDVAAYLDASRQALDCEEMTVDWRHDVTFDGDGVSIQQYRARHVIACEGFAATRNPYFAEVPFNPAKGDILTVRFNRPLPPQTIHRGIWIAPTSEPDVFRVGSTYDRTNFDLVPSAAALSEIEGKLRDFLRVPYTVLDHKAAVRPIIDGSRALVGLHPDQHQLGFFNGLGSKGSLHGPWYADCFTNFLLHGSPLPEDMDVRKHF